MSRSALNNRDSSVQPVAACDAASRLFSSGFDELCAWLLELLESGILVPMIDIANQYERILTRRKESATESMLRTTFIRNRLEKKYGSLLCFEKLNNYEVNCIDTQL